MSEDKQVYFEPPAVFRELERLRAVNSELLEACKRALPWVGKLIASRVHEDCVMPNDAVRTMEMLEAYIAKAEGRA